jgi:hypothetical protein
MSGDPIAGRVLLLGLVGIRGLMVMASGLALGLSSLIKIIAVPVLMLPSLVWSLEEDSQLHRLRLPGGPACRILRNVLAIRHPPLAREGAALWPLCPNAIMPGSDPSRRDRTWSRPGIRCT